MKKVVYYWYEFFGALMISFINSSSAAFLVQEEILSKGEAFMIVTLISILYSGMIRYLNQERFFSFPLVWNFLSFSIVFVLVNFLLYPLTN